VAGEIEKGKTALGCGTEREELKNRHREHDRMTESKKGQRAGEHWRKKNNHDSTGREVWRKKNTKEEKKERKDS